MKYALISEEQITQIEDAMSEMQRGLSHDCEDTVYEKYETALATIKLLKPHEPVGFISKETDYFSKDEHLVGAIDDQTLTVGTELFALEQK